MVHGEPEASAASAGVVRSLHGAELLKRDHVALKRAPRQAAISGFLAHVEPTRGWSGQEIPHQCDPG